MEPRHVALLPSWGCAAWGGGAGADVGVGGRTELALSAAARPVRSFPSSHLLALHARTEEALVTYVMIAWPGLVGLRRATGHSAGEGGSQAFRCPGRSRGPRVGDLATWGLNLPVYKIAKLKDHACSWVSICIPQSPKENDAIGVFQSVNEILLTFSSYQTAV